MVFRSIKIGEHKMTRSAQKLPQYWVYIEGYRMVQARVGYKWVKYKSPNMDQNFTRISRAKWDKCCLRTKEEFIERSNVYKRARELEIPLIKKTKILKSHPTRKFGWMYKSYEDLLDEVLIHDTRRAA